MRRYQGSYLLPQEMHRQKPVCIIPSHFDACVVQGAPRVTMQSQRQGHPALPPPQKSVFKKNFPLAAAVTRCQTCSPQPGLELLGRVTQQHLWVHSQAGSPPCLTSCCSPFNSFSREALQPIPAEGDELRAQSCLLQPECLGVPAGLPSTCSWYVLGSLHSPKLFSLSFQLDLVKLGILRLGLEIPFGFPLALSPARAECDAEDGDGSCLSSAKGSAPGG